MKKFLVLSLFLCMHSLAAQNPAGVMRGLQRFLFPPELVMRNQSVLNLSAEQSQFIRKEIQEAQAEFTAVQWDLQGEMETLVNLLKQPDIQESDLLGQFESVLDLERKIKRTQMILAFRIWRTLTPEQRKTLGELRRNFREPPGGPGPF